MKDQKVKVLWGQEMTMALVRSGKIDSLLCQESGKWIPWGQIGIDEQFDITSQVAGILGVDHRTL